MTYTWEVRAVKRKRGGGLEVVSDTVTTSQKDKDGAFGKARKKHKKALEMAVFNPTEGK